MCFHFPFKENNLESSSHVSNIITPTLNFYEKLMIYVGVSKDNNFTKDYTSVGSIINKDNLSTTKAQRSYSIQEDDLYNHSVGSKLDNVEEARAVMPALHDQPITTGSNINESNYIDDNNHQELLPLPSHSEPSEEINTQYN